MQRFSAERSEGADGTGSGDAKFRGWRELAAGYDRSDAVPGIVQTPLWITGGVSVDFTNKKVCYTKKIIFIRTFRNICH